MSYSAKSQKRYNEKCIIKTINKKRYGSKEIFIELYIQLIRIYALISLNHAELTGISSDISVFF